MKIKPVNEACLGKMVKVTDDKWVDSVGSPKNGILLAIDNHERPYICTDENLKNSCGVYRRFAIAERLSDVIYGDEDED